MSTKSIFTMKLESELRETFMAETAAADRPASQVVRELMREYIERRRREREYDEFVRKKVDLARVSVREGHGRSNEEMEADAVKRRGLWLRSADEAGG